MVVVADQRRWRDADAFTAFRIPMQSLFETKITRHFITTATSLIAPHPKARTHFTAFPIFLTLTGTGVRIKLPSFRTLLYRGIFTHTFAGFFIKVLSEGTLRQRRRAFRSRAATVNTFGGELSRTKFPAVIETTALIILITMR